MPLDKMASWRNDIVPNMKICRVSLRWGPAVLGAKTSADLLLAWRLGVDRAFWAEVDLSTSTPFSSANRRFLHPITSAVLPSAVTLKRDAFCRVYTSQDISYWFSSSLWRYFVSYASTFNDSILVFFVLMSFYFSTSTSAQRHLDSKPET